MEKMRIVKMCYSVPYACWTNPHRCYLTRREQIIATAVRVLGSKDIADRWLLTPALALNWNRPCDVLSENSEYDKVDLLLLRIEHGIYT